MKLFVSYSKAPKQPQSSANLYVNLTLWQTRGSNQRPYALLHIGACRATHYITKEGTKLKGPKGFHYNTFIHFTH